MDFEQELKRVAGAYAGQGYQVVVRPRPEDLPPFAKDFKVEVVGKRATEGVLVAVKKNREEMAANAALQWLLTTEVSEGEVAENVADFAVQFLMFLAEARHGFNASRPDTDAQRAILEAACQAEE